MQLLLGVVSVSVFFFFFFFLVSQAFTTMLAKRGTVFVRGCILWVPLIWFVNSTLSYPKPFSFVYCCAINQRGRWL